MPHTILNSSIQFEMASYSLHTNLNFLRLPNPSTTTTTTSPRRLSINMGGPRSNRGPLVKGRILSIEAIHTIQALKRAQRTSPTTLDSDATRILQRLIKADLLSTLKELLRQNHFRLARLVFEAFRAEYRPDFTLYADLANGLTSQGLAHEVDEVVASIVDIDFDDKGFIKLVKALFQADRRDSAVRIYGLMKECGWGSSVEVDEYVAKVLSSGFRRMGEDGLADGIDKEVNVSFRSNLAKPVV